MKSLRTACYHPMDFHAFRMQGTCMFSPFMGLTAQLNRREPDDLWKHWTGVETLWFGFGAEFLGSGFVLGLGDTEYFGWYYILHFIVVFRIRAGQYKTREITSFLLGGPKSGTVGARNAIFVYFRAESKSYVAYKQYKSFSWHWKSNRQTPRKHRNGLFLAVNLLFLDNFGQRFRNYVPTKQYRLFGLPAVKKMTEKFSGGPLHLGLGSKCRIFGQPEISVGPALFV